MENEKLKLFIIPFILFILGVLFLIIGINGDSFANIFSRPVGDGVWVASGTLIDTFTMVPKILGVTFLILFISTFTVSFKNSQNKS